MKQKTITSTRLLRALDRLRTIDPEFTVTAARGLAYVANNSPCTQADMARELKIEQSNASRIVDRLGTKTRGQKLGYGLITKTNDNTDARNRILTITQKGLDVLTVYY